MLNSTEATETFFAITKLFQSKDVSGRSVVFEVAGSVHFPPFLQVTLRRLVYLAIKEMATIADDVIIVTSR